ncbi:MAG: hypothetical protein K2N63_16880 [Lachnospiraceae bacterium]|nr:hypothetical protein [Lachnospiraceae bacterium]
MKKKSTIITVIVMLLVGAAIVAAYFIVSARKNKENYEGGNRTEVDILLEKDLDKSYPLTSREVVKFYSRILKCYYNKKLTQEQLEDLLDQMRKLFDEEFLAENPRDSHLMELQEEISDFAARKCQITSYQVEQNGNIVTWTDEGKEYARVIASYTEKEDRHYLKVYEEFILRKDSGGKWKILGWYLTDADAMK